MNAAGHQFMHGAGHCLQGLLWRSHGQTVVLRLVIEVFLAEPTAVIIARAEKEQAVHQGIDSIHSRQTRAVKKKAPAIRFP